MTGLSILLNAKNGDYLHVEGEGSNLFMFDIIFKTVEDDKLIAHGSINAGESLSPYSNDVMPYTQTICEVDHLSLVRKCDQNEIDNINYHFERWGCPYDSVKGALKKEASRY